MPEDQITPEVERWRKFVAAHESGDVSAAWELGSKMVEKQIAENNKPKGDKGIDHDAEPKAGPASVPAPELSETRKQVVDSKHIKSEQVSGSSTPTTSIKKIPGPKRRTPDKKVGFGVAGGLGGGEVARVILYAVPDMPFDVALTLATFVIVLFTFVAAYLTPREN